MALTIYKSKFSDGTLPVVTGDCAGDAIVNDYFVDVTAAQIVANDIIDLGPLPAYHTVSDAILVCDDLDTVATPTITLDVGIMSGTVGDTVTERTCGTELFAAATAAQGGSAVRASAVTAFKIKSSDSDRSIGVKFKAGAATAAAGRIRLRVFMHPSDQNITF